MDELQVYGKYTSLLKGSVLLHETLYELMHSVHKQTKMQSNLIAFHVQAEKCEIVVGDKRSHSALDLVRTPQMRKRAFILFYIW